MLCVVLASIIWCIWEHKCIHTYSDWRKSWPAWSIPNNPWLNLDEYFVFICLSPTCLNRSHPEIFKYLSYKWPLLESEKCSDSGFPWQLPSFYLLVLFLQLHCYSFYSVTFILFFFFLLLIWCLNFNVLDCIVFLCLWIEMSRVWMVLYK